MTKLRFVFAATLLTLVAGVTETTWGRGFGGMHGGGMHMPGGGMHMAGGGMHMPGGGMHFPTGGFGGGAGFGSGNFAGARPGIGSFGGARPGGANFAGSPLGGANLGRGPSEFSPGGGFGHQGFPGGSAGGFGGNREGPGAIGGLGRPDGGPPSGRQLGNFLGLPSDGGMHGGLGNHIGGDQRGHQRHPAPDLARHGALVRRDFRGRGFYNNDWYRRHPGAWYPARWAYGTVWAAMTWAYLDGWFGYGDADPIYYDYGNTVVYQDNSVYVNGQDVGTSDEYYQQAEDLADTGAEAQTNDDDHDSELSGCLWLTGLQYRSASQPLKGRELTDDGSSTRSGAIREPSRSDSDCIVRSGAAAAASRAGIAHRLDRRDRGHAGALCCKTLPLSEITIRR